MHNSLKPTSYIWHRSCVVQTAELITAVALLVLFMSVTLSNIGLKLLPFIVDFGNWEGNEDIGQQESSQQNEWKKIEEKDGKGTKA